MGSLKFAAPPAAATNRNTPSPRHPSPSDTSTHSPPSHEPRNGTSSPSLEIDTFMHGAVQRREIASRVGGRRWFE
eukprot:528489-Prymnesium_polylepis.1